MQRNALICAYNLYKGGSKTLFEALSSEIEKRDGVSIFRPKYPLRYFNFGYRIFLDQFISPLIGRGAKLVLFGNAAALLRGSPQVVFVHNPNYWSDSWRRVSLRNRLEFLYFYFSNKVAIYRGKVNYCFQIPSVQSKFLEIFPNARTRVIGSPVARPEEVELSSISRYVKEKIQAAGPFIFYPAFFYPNKNHKLLSLCSDYIKEKFGFSIVVTHGGGLSGLIELGHVETHEVQWIVGQSEAIIFPSTHETFGYPLVEAAGYNKPVLALDREYSREVVRNCYYFENSSMDLNRAVGEFYFDWVRGNLRIVESTVITSPSEFLSALVSDQ